MADSIEVTLTVAALRELLKRGEMTCFWINLPYTSQRNYQRHIQIRETRRTEDDVELVVSYEENGRTMKEVTVSVAEIFGLAENVRALLARAKEQEEMLRE